MRKIAVVLSQLCISMLVLLVLLPTITQFMLSCEALIIYVQFLKFLLDVSDPRLSKLKYLKSDSHLPPQKIVQFTSLKAL